MQVMNLHEIEAMADLLISKHNTALIGRGEEITITESVRFLVEVKRKLLQMRGAEVPDRAGDQ